MRQTECEKKEKIIFFRREKQKRNKLQTKDASKKIVGRKKIGMAANSTTNSGQTTGRYTYCQ